MTSNPNNIISLQELKDAKEDAKDLGDALNTKQVITPRYGNQFNSLPLALDNLAKAIQVALAAGAGAAGWMDSLVQTWSGQTQEEKNKDLVSLSDYCVGDGVTDDSDNILNALSTIKGTAVIPRNFKILITKSLEITNPDLYGVVGDCEFSSELIFKVDGRLIFAQTVEELPPLINYSVQSRNNLQFTQTIDANIESQDVIILWNPEPYSLISERSYYYDGCMMLAHKKEADRILLFGKVPKMNQSNIKAYLMKRKPFVLRNFSYDIQNLRNVIRITHYVGVRVNNVVSKNLNGFIGIKIDKSYDVVIDAGNHSCSHDVAYPIQISNSQNFKIMNYIGTSSRHGIGLGGDDFGVSVPCRDGLIINSTLLNYQPGGVNGIGVNAADTHAGIIDITYENCLIASGAGINGRNIKYKKCVIESYTHPNAGRCANGNSPVQGLIEFNQCTFRITRAQVDADGSIIRFAPVHKMDGKVTYRFKDCDLDFVNDVTSNTVFPFIRFTKEWIENLNVDIEIDGLKSNGSIIYNELIRIEKPASPVGGSMTRISIKNVGGINYRAYVTGQIDAIDTKINIKGWEVPSTIPLVSGTQEATATITIPTTYPRPPAITCISVGTQGASTGWILGGRGYTSDQATLYANKLTGGNNVFTGNMSVIVKSELIEW